MASVILATAPIHGHVSAYLSSWPSMEETGTRDRACTPR